MSSMKRELESIRYRHFVAKIFALKMVPSFQLCRAEEKIHNFLPTEGYVPNEATAVRIAEAVWLPIYGEAVLKEKPFHATLADEIWTVEGTLAKEYQQGGVALAQISKIDGHIIRVSHGK